MAEEEKGQAEEVKAPEVKPEETQNPPEEEQPQTRFPKQSKEDKIAGFQLRKGRLDELEKENQELKDKLLEENEILPKVSPPSGQVLDDLRSEFDQKLNSVREEHGSERLLNDFVKNYPDYKKYEDKIRSHMNHQAYRNVPIGFIADGIAGKEVAMEKIKEVQSLDKEAGNSETGGTSTRKPQGNFPDFWKMSPGDFESFKENIRNKSRE